MHGCPDRHRLNIAVTREGIRKPSSEERKRLGYCDGMAFDAEGNLWITLPFANRIIALSPDGRKHDLLHDAEHMNMPTNLAWGGRNRRDLFVVTRGNGSVVNSRTTVKGLETPNQR